MDTYPVSDGFYKKKKLHNIRCLRRFLFVSINACLFLILLDYAISWQGSIFVGNGSKKTCPTLFAAILFASLATFYPSGNSRYSNLKENLWIAAWICIALFPVSHQVIIRLFGAEVGATEWNAALTVILLAASHKAKKVLPNLALSLAVTASIIVASALVSMAFQKRELFEGMSVMTAFTLFLLCIANLTKFIRHPIIFYFCGTGHEEKVIRLQTLLWGMSFLIIPVLYGAMHANPESGIPVIYGVSMVGIFASMVCFGSQLLRDNYRLKVRGRKLKNMATIDQLTGAKNKFTIRDDDMMKPGGDRAVAVFDIDNFKNINESLGHTTGDLILQKFVERICECLDEQDNIYRWGGDEFIVTLRRSCRSEINMVIRMMYDRVNAITIQDHKSLAIQFSCGVVCLDADEIREIDDCIEEADICLRRAKSLGKNMVLFSSKMKAFDNIVPVDFRPIAK